MPEEAFTFSELRKIQKEESRQEELTERNEKFLLKVSDYLDTKKQVSDDSREYRNARRIFDKIIGLREEKIVKNAKLAVQSDVDPSGLNLLPVEQELFRDLKSLFSDHRVRIDERLEGSVENGSIDETEQSGSEEEVDGGFVKVKVTSDVPEFMGTDLESYGPLDEGDQVEVPEENAEILVNRGTAERID